jgi:hypothetical protein
MNAPATLALLEYLEEIYRAAMTRDADGVHALLRRPLALHVPIEVRAEAIAIANAPAASLRAPIRLLQMQQRVAQLGESDDDESQLELELRQAR